MSSGKPQSQFDNFDDDDDFDDEDLDDDEMTFKEELVYDLAALVHAWQDDAPVHTPLGLGSRNTLHPVHS